MPSRSGLIATVPRVKAPVVIVLAMAMGAKVAFHEWTAATIHPASGDYPVMKVKRIPCRTGDDLQPGNVCVYARVYGRVRYVELRYGPQDPRRIIVPVLPPRLTSPVVTVTGSVIWVFEAFLPAPFVVVSKTEPPKISVDQYEIRIHSPCKILLQPTITGPLKYFPPVFVINGKSTRRPSHVACKNVAVIMPYALPMVGEITSTHVASVVSISGERLIVNTYSVYAPKGAAIKWEPACSIVWAAYADIAWRWPHWPYSL